MNFREELKQIVEDGLNDFLNKEAVGWDVKLIVEVVNPTNPMANKIKKAYDFKALISKNEDAYKKSDNTSNMEFKICKIFVADIEEYNKNGANIPVPDNSLKKANATIKLDNGNEFQITNESFEGFNKRLYVLEIQRQN